MAKAKKEKAPSASAADPGYNFELRSNIFNFYRRIGCIKLFENSESTIQCQYDGECGNFLLMVVCS